jgi:hypothetical protein
LKIILFLKGLRKKMWANFQRIIELFTEKIESKLSKISVWDPGSEIRDPEKKTYSGSRIPDSGFRIPDFGAKRHRIRICNTGQWAMIFLVKEALESRLLGPRSLICRTQLISATGSLELALLT